MKASFFEFRAGLSYEKALGYQGFLNDSGHIGLLAFECPETITLGRAAELQSEVLVSPQHLQERQITLLATDRGGKATYHGPGQLVGFPIGNLRTLYGSSKAVRRFTEELLFTLAHACAALGVKSVETRLDQPGLWTSKGKLASVGFNVKDGYLFHGFSLNVKASVLAGYKYINPCGMAGCPITYLEQEGVKEMGMEQLLFRLAPYLNSILQRAGVDTSEIFAHKNAYAHLVTTVTRSQMAIDHLGSRFESVHYGEQETAP